MTSCHTFLATIDCNAPIGNLSKTELSGWFVSSMWKIKGPKNYFMGKGLGRCSVVKSSVVLAKIPHLISSIHRVAKNFESLKFQGDLIPSPGLLGHNKLVPHRDTHSQNTCTHKKKTRYFK